MGKETQCSGELRLRGGGITGVISVESKNPHDQERQTPRAKAEGTSMSICSIRPIDS